MTAMIRAARCVIFSETVLLDCPERSTCKRKLLALYYWDISRRKVVSPRTSGPGSAVTTTLPVLKEAAIFRPSAEAPVSCRVPSPVLLRVITGKNGSVTSPPCARRRSSGWGKSLRLAA